MQSTAENSQPLPSKQQQSEEAAQVATADFQQIVLNARPMGGLRRQPTKYPHGLGISVQSIDEQNYSKASTLRSSWDGGLNLHGVCRNVNSHRKYRISRIANPEALAELQVRRYKYALSNYMDATETPKPTQLWLEYLTRFCRWKYLRWPIIFIASVLIFFGFITYCIWLHDISIAREKYLQRRNRLTDLDDFSSELITLNTESILRMSTTTERPHGLQESTILRAISNRKRLKGPIEQKLTTLEYGVSKGDVEWIKNGKTKAKDEEDTTTESMRAMEQNPGFTSGHQNSFGISREDDERNVLRDVSY